MSKPIEFKLKRLRVPTGWKVDWNKFMDLEPDNDYSIDEVWIHFDEDISSFKNGEYFIDLGFYGNYLERKSGFFRLYIGKGDFTEGTLFESFISRKTEEIREKIEEYMWLISNGEIRKYKGLKYGGRPDISDYLFSVLEETKVEMKEVDLDKYMNKA